MLGRFINEAPSLGHASSFIIEEKEGHVLRRIILVFHVWWCDIVLAYEGNKVFRVVCIIDFAPYDETTAPTALSTLLTSCPAKHFHFEEDMKPKRFSTLNMKETVRTAWIASKLTTCTASSNFKIHSNLKLFAR